MNKSSMQILITGCHNLCLDVNHLMVEQLSQYVGLLQKWNKVYNLTAIVDQEKIVSHHILDSLAIAHWVIGSTILDVGTGAGLPGIPLAIYYPHKKFILVDSVGKKIRFLQQVILELGLKNVTLVESRVEKFNTDISFDVIISRAVGELNNIMTLTSHLLHENGEWLFMKGKIPEGEIQNLLTINPVNSITTHQLYIPGLDAQRHLIIVKHKEY